MARILDRSDSRGIANQGWLYSRHTFSFSSYHNPERMGFGLLRVINDDIVEPSMGFGTHPHENMEIISIPLSGSLRHEDSMGNKHVILTGEVQVMSAGTGITHSEYNNSDTDEVNFLQIWVMPKELDISPRYDQKRIEMDNICNSFKRIVAPLGVESLVNINQNAYFSIANIDADNFVEYKKENGNNGVYLFVIKGKINIGATVLSDRDGLGISEEDNVKIFAQNKSRVLCMEVPMK